MEPVLVFLSYLAVILLLGLLTSIVSQKFKIPNILFLLLIGIVIGKVKYKGAPLIFFPELFMTGISLLALVMIVFDSATRFNLKRLDRFSLKTLWLSVVFLVLNMIALTLFLILLFDVESIFLALMFSALMSGTDPAAVLTMLRKSTTRVFEFLKLEALLNTPLIVLLPFIILDFEEALDNQFILTTLIGQFLPLLQQFVVGLGSGLLIGLIVFKFMRKKYSVVLSPLAVITSALLAYVIAEGMEGNGVLAVTTMGLLFGNVYVKHKFELEEFSTVLSTSLEILVFVLIGLVVSIPVSFDFFVKSILLFSIYLSIRFVAVAFTIQHINFSLKEKIFMTLNVQKGIAVAVVVFSLANLKIAGMEDILNLVLAFMLYSIVLSTIAIRVSAYFVHVEKKSNGQK